jgi:hypothetical protein
MFSQHSAIEIIYTQNLTRPGRLSPDRVQESDFCATTAQALEICDSLLKAGCYSMRVVSNAHGREIFTYLGDERSGM